MFEKIRLEFLIDTDKYSVANAINHLRNYILMEYSPSSVKDVDYGQVSMDEAIEDWGFSSYQDYIDKED